MVTHPPYFESGTAMPIQELDAARRRPGANF